MPDISNWNTDNVFNIEELFSGCISLASLPDITKWNTDNIENMNYFMKDCPLLLYFPEKYSIILPEYEKSKDIKNSQKMKDEMLLKYNENDEYLEEKNLIKGILDIKLKKIEDNIILFIYKN